MQERQTHSYMGNFSKGNDHIARQCTQPMKVHNSAWFKEKMLLAQVQNAGIALSKEQLAILADTGEKLILAQDCEQQAFVDDSNDEFTSESNMISYEQYLKEKKSQVVQNTPSPANQDSMIMFVIEQMSNSSYKSGVKVIYVVTAKVKDFEWRDDDRDYELGGQKWRPDSGEWDRKTRMVTLRAGQVVQTI
ncbi:hypothetical protein Tco_1110030 [Tanacetum coccineum]|uniref:Uncharacterized protein n=1 Tax=Tanacetum coccineum TaxID=301880 RepID=A0ABQ5IHL1_9ASTR